MRPARFWLISRAGLSRSAWGIGTADLALFCRGRARVGFIASTFIFIERHHLGFAAIISPSRRSALIALNMRPMATDGKLTQGVAYPKRALASPLSPLITWYREVIWQTAGSG